MSSFTELKRDTLARQLRKHTQGEVRFDDGSRALYATDASNYRQVPFGVVVPRHIDEVEEIIAACREHELPVLARGGGTSLAGQCFAEFIGTFIVILLGNGAVSVAVMTSALTGSGAIDGWAVAMIWGLGVTFGIYVAGPVSGAHFNPAVTIAMAVFRDFPVKKIPAYILSQVAGAYIASACVYGVWRGFWPQAAEKLGVQIGQPGSQKMMSMFACFYPSPGLGTDAGACAYLDRQL